MPEKGASVDAPKGGRIAGPPLLSSPEAGAAAARASGARAFRILQGDALTMLGALPDESVHCCVTSPPYYGLRDYGIPPSTWPDGWVGCLGLEPTLEMYVLHCVFVFREVRRVLRPDGTLWLNLGDSYCSDAGADRKSTTLGGPRVPAGWTNRAQPHRVHALRKGKDKDPKRGEAADTGVISAVTGLKPKDLCMIPARVALALQADGWWVRQDIIWNKPNPMPESVQDRCTKAHEYLYLLSKSADYYCDMDAIREPSTGNAHDRARKERSIDGQKTLPTGERNGMRAYEREFGRPGEPDPHGPIARESAANAQKWPNAWSAEEGPHDGVGNGRFRPKQNGKPPARYNFARDTKEADVPGANNRQHRTDREPTYFTGTRNKRSVWSINTEAYPEGHFATFPKALVEPCILAGCPEGGTVVDPFGGSSTVGVVALRHNRSAILIELKPAYCELIRNRIMNDMPMFNKEDTRADAAGRPGPTVCIGGGEQAAPDTATEARNLLRHTPEAAELARCEEEIRLYRSAPGIPGEKAFLAAMGEADWHAEKRLLERKAKA